MLILNYKTSAATLFLQHSPTQNHTNVKDLNRNHLFEPISRQRCSIFRHVQFGGLYIRCFAGGYVGSLGSDASERTLALITSTTADPRHTRRQHQMFATQDGQFTGGAARSDCLAR